MVPHSLLPMEAVATPVVSINQVRHRNGSAKQFVVRGSQKGAAYDYIFSETLREHRQTRELAYVARKGKHLVVVQNNRVSMLYDLVWLESLYFTPNGAALFYLAERARETVFVVNGIEESAYTTVFDVRPLEPRDDGTAIGLEFAALVGKQLQWVQTRPRLTSMEESVFSSDGF